MKLKEVATIERPKQGKNYEEGCSLVQVSATKGQVVYHHGGEVDSKYAVIKVKPGVRLKPKFLFFCLDRILSTRLDALKTGLNIQMIALENMEM